MDNNNHTFKVLIFLIILTSIISSNTSNHSSNISDTTTLKNQPSQSITESQNNEIISEVQLYLETKGLKDIKIMTKKLYYNFLSQLYDKQELPKEQRQIYEIMVKKLTAQVPDEFPMSDVPKYIAGPDIENKIQEVMTELYGDVLYNKEKKDL